MAQEPLPPTGELILYATEDGRARVECRFAGETVWLSQALMAELFDISVPTVNEHLHNIFEEAELDPAATIRKFRIVRREGSAWHLSPPAARRRLRRGHRYPELPPYLLPRR